MKLKEAIMAWTILLTSQVVLAEETNNTMQEVKKKWDDILWDCTQSISIWQKNMFRNNAGFTPVDNSVTELSTSIKCWNIDSFAWLAQNNETNKVNQVNLWIWYSDKIWDINYRAGLEEWYFNEKWWDTQLASLWINYKNIWAVYKKFLDWENWSIFSFKVSENFKLWELKDYLLSLNIEARTTFLNNVFWKNWHTNDKYTVSLTWTNWDTSINWFVSYHDWHNWQKDATQVWIRWVINFNNN